MTTEKANVATITHTYRAALIEEMTKSEAPVHAKAPSGSSIFRGHG